MALQSRAARLGGRRVPAFGAPFRPPFARSTRWLTRFAGRHSGGSPFWITALLVGTLAGCHSSADPFRNPKYRVAAPRRDSSQPTPSSGARLPTALEAPARAFTPLPERKPTEASKPLIPALNEEDRPILGFEPITQAVAFKPDGTTTIHGRVIDASGRPQPLVNVVAVTTDRPGGQRVETTTDANGNFGFHGVAAGRRYLILASAIHSNEPLIGRVTVTPPNQSVVIEIARPSVGARGASQGTRPLATVNTQPGTIAQVRPSVVPPDSTRSARPDIVRDTESASPWDTPGPPAASSRGVSPSAPHPAAPVAGNSNWRPASTPRTASGGLEARRPTPSLPPARSATTGTATPGVPTARPTDTRSAAPSDRTWVARNKPVESQPNSTHPVSPADTRPPLARPTQIAAASSMRQARAPEPSDQGGGLTPPPVPPLNRQETVAVHPKLEPNPAAPTTMLSLSAPALGTGQMPSCRFDGDRLVDFRLPDLQLQPISFSGLDSEFVLLDFWGTWCGYCLKATPQLVDLQRRFGGQGLQVIGIAYEQGDVTERVLKVQQMREQLQINYPLLLGDVGGPCPLREKFQVHLYPTLVLLDRSGRIVWRSEGANPPEFQRLENLLKNQLASRSNGYK